MNVLKDHFLAQILGFEVITPERFFRKACIERGNGLSNRLSGWVRGGRVLVGLDLAFGHDGGCATGFVFFVYLAIHDLHALKIFLDDFFPGEFDVLFRLTPCPLAHSVDHVFFHQNTNLFGQIGTGRQFRNPLADDLSFRHVALTFADEVLVG